MQIGLNFGHFDGPVIVSQFSNFQFPPPGWGLRRDFKDAFDNVSRLQISITIFFTGSVCLMQPQMFWGRKRELVASVPARLNAVGPRTLLQLSSPLAAPTFSFSLAILSGSFSGPGTFLYLQLWNEWGPRCLFSTKTSLSWIPFHALCLVTVCGVDKPLHAKVLVGQINSRCPSWRILTSPSGDTVSFLKDGGEFPSFSNKCIDYYSEGTEMDANVNQTCPTLEECNICIVGEMRQVCK